MRRKWGEQIIYSPLKERNGIDLAAAMSMKERRGDYSLVKSDKMG